MIKPPFTVIILKESETPVTLRISGGFLVTMILFVCLCAGLGIAGLVITLSGDSKSTSVKTEEPPSPAPAFRLVEHADPLTERAAPPNTPDIKDISFSSDTTSLDITVNLLYTESHPELYVWLIADQEEYAIVCPRSPLFRGLPVDFRNGIIHHATDPPSVQASLPDIAAVTDISTLRILAFAKEGSLVIDKTFTLRHNKRM